MHRMKLGDKFPDFTAETDRGTIKSFHDWIGPQKWAILFSHPADFTPVCTTELAKAVDLAPQFEKLGVRMIALSCNSAETHEAWKKDILATAETGAVQGDSFPFEIIADENRQLAHLLEMFDPAEFDSNGLPLTARAVFVIGPDRKLKLSILYPATTGRDFGEILRVVKSLILTYKEPVATPEGWKPGDDVILQPWFSTEEAKKAYGEDSVITTNLPSGKEYLRRVKDPLHKKPE